MNAIRGNNVLRKPCLMVQLATVVSFAWAGIATAMQEYEDLKILIEAFTSEIEASAVQDGYTEDLCIILRSSEPTELPRILVLVDELEYRVERELAIVAVEKEAGGNKVAGTRVRKQMQKIKQAAQLVRNQILEIR